MSSSADTSFDADELSDLLEDFEDTVNTLNKHPDKAIINALTLLSDDNQQYLPQIYNLIKNKIASHLTPALHKLPLLYLVDSMLNNCTGPACRSTIEPSVTDMFRSMYTAVSDEHRGKMKKVLRLWTERGQFGTKEIEGMQRLFGDGPTQISNSSSSSSSRASYSLASIPAPVVSRMRQMLGDMGSEMGETVTLEQLVSMNEGLVRQMEEQARGEVGSSASSSSSSSSSVPPPPPPPTSSNLWHSAVPIDPSAAAALVADLDQTLVALTTSAADPIAQAALYPISLACSATSQFLSTLLADLPPPLPPPSNSSSSSSSSTSSSSSASSSSASSSSSSQGPGGIRIDPKDFTNEGIKKKHPTSVYDLYNRLPFLSKSDGRRFRTQKDLSEHLDGVFQKNRAEKDNQGREVVAVRRWLRTEADWVARKELEGDTPEAEGTDDDGEGEEDVVDADESRPSCAICGKNFSSAYSDDRAGYVYADAREHVVEEDNGMESDEQLAHASCCKKLGIERGGVLYRNQML